MHSPIFNCALVDNLLVAATSSCSYSWILSTISSAWSFITIMIILYMHMYHIHHIWIYIHACQFVTCMRIRIYIACIYILDAHAAHHLPPLLHSLTQTHTWALEHLVTSHSLMNSPISNCALVEKVVSFTENETICCIFS